MLRGIFLCIFVWTVIAVTLVDSRYLPTRSQDDRLGRLRELLKDRASDLDEEVFDIDPLMERSLLIKRTLESMLSPYRIQQTNLRRQSRQPAVHTFYRTQ